MTHATITLADTQTDGTLLAWNLYSMTLTEALAELRASDTDTLRWACAVLDGPLTEIEIRHDRDTRTRTSMIMDLLADTFWSNHPWHSAS